MKKLLFLAFLVTILFSTFASCNNGGGEECRIEPGTSANYFLRDQSDNSYYKANIQWLTTTALTADTLGCGSIMLGLGFPDTFYLYHAEFNDYHLAVITLLDKDNPIVGDTLCN